MINNQALLHANSKRDVLSNVFDTFSRNKTMDLKAETMLQVHNLLDMVLLYFGSVILICISYELGKKLGGVIRVIRNHRAKQSKESC